MKDNKGKYDLEFFLMNESFIDWNKGDEKQDLFWKKWISENQEAIQEFELARKMLKEIQIRKETVEDIWIESIKNRIDQDIEKNALNNNKVYALTNSDNKYNWLKISGIAASIAIIAAFAFLLVPYFNAQNELISEPVAIQKETLRGQKLTIYLSDGSKVRLNSESFSINYGTIFFN